MNYSTRDLFVPSREWYVPSIDWGFNEITILNARLQSSNIGDVSKYIASTYFVYYNGSYESSGILGCTGYVSVSTTNNRSSVTTHTEFIGIDDGTQFGKFSEFYVRSNISLGFTIDIGISCSTATKQSGKRFPVILELTYIDFIESWLIQSPEYSTTTARTWRSSSSSFCQSLHSSNFPTTT